MTYRIYVIGYCCLWFVAVGCGKEAATTDAGSTEKDGGAVETEGIEETEGTADTVETTESSESNDTGDSDETDDTKGSADTEEADDTEETSQTEESAETAEENTSGTEETSNTEDVASESEETTETEETEETQETEATESATDTEGITDTEGTEYTEDSTDSDTESQTTTGFDVIEGKDGSRFVPLWHDEFDGPEIDTSKWRVADEYPDMDLPYRRNWMPKNVYVEDGALVIRTMEEDDGTYSTGGVRTGYYEPFEDWEFGQAFGRFEARILPPTQQGHWSAFWLLSPSVGEVDGSGQDGTEIDIIEFAYADIDKTNHALHWDGYDDDHQSEGKDITGMNIHDGDWHTITLEWYPDEYIFYIDGVETWRTNAGGVSQVPQYIKLTEEIGNYGTGPNEWGAGPIEEADLPDYTRFDYVRVWEYQAE